MPKETKKTKSFKDVQKIKAFIYSTYNNTIVTITDSLGRVIVATSAGKLGFIGPKKATPHAAGIVVRTAFEKIKDLGVKEVQLFVKGIGTGRDAAVRAFAGLGLNVVSIKDTTPVPHNGCRSPKPRRV